MLTSTFYKLINTELEQILAKYPDDEELHKHKDDDQNKGYAFLVWFLDFYGQTKTYKRYITDGKDDSSCDIIFSNIDSQGQEIYYIVQSKWVNIKIGEDGQLLRKNKPIQEYPQIKKEEFNAVMSDFATVANGSRKEGKNEVFNQKYQNFITHLERNGKAKFIFFTAADHNDEVNDNIEAFRKEYAPNITFELIDIHRIKRDYIEFKFKEIVANNPLEYTYSPEDSDIELEIERYKNGGSPDHAYLSTRDMLQFEGRTQAYIFTIKPKTIHELFRKYKFKLFFKNVRNPLHRSNYNEKIVETLQRRPDTFWYFNNGITAITKRIPDVGKTASTLTIKGLQIINGAQTVYSVYQAYENANADQREIMDTDARISFRLIRSSDEDFNLEITRFTNSQNAMEPRDFVANLEEQQRLQNESFKTKYWYEKRRGEFRLEEEKLEELDVDVVENELFASAYVAFHLQKPSLAGVSGNKFFIKRGDDPEGLYEEIFNEHTKFDDMLTAFFMWVIFLPSTKKLEQEGEGAIERGINNWFVLSNLALTKIVLQKHLEHHLTSDTKIVNLNELIKRVYYSDEHEDNRILFPKAINLARNFILTKIQNEDKEKSHSNIRKLISSQAFYDIIRQEVEDQDIDLNTISMNDIKKSHKEFQAFFKKLFEDLKV